MGALATHLKDVMSTYIADNPDPAWTDIVSALNKGDNLEGAMAKISLQKTTVDAIVAETAKLIAAAERKVIDSVLKGERELPFTVFAKHIFKAGKKFHLITPNYDRLIELAVEAAGIGVDSRFFGYLHACSDPKRSADAHRESFFSGRNASFRQLPCLCIHKPHGSLDWFELNGKLVRCPMPVGKPPIIITPGTSKYRESFRWAFDDQRTAGNRVAGNATRLLFIGYGFNDDHLEQYLCPDLRLTKPSIILAKHLTANAWKVMENSKTVSVTALCAVSDHDNRTRIVTSSGEEIVENEVLWNLEDFNKGVI